MVEKQKTFSRLLEQGVSVSEACRRLSIDRKTGHWWKNGGVIERNGVVRVVHPVVGQVPTKVASPRYLSVEERTVIADGHRAGRSATSIAEQLGRAVSTVARELKRNRTEDGRYEPHRAHATMLARRPRPKERILTKDDELRGLVQGYLDKRWSPEQIVHELEVEHGRRIAVETIYQALYSLLRDYFPKSTDLRVHNAEDLVRVSDELNRRPRKTLDWQTPHDLFSTLQERFA